MYIVYLVYIMPMALDCGFEQMEATFLLSIMSLGSLGGRAVSGFLVRPKVPAEAEYGFSQLLCTIGVLCAQAERGGGLVASACFMGIGTGMSRAVSTVLLRKIVGLHNLASAIGISYLFGGIGDLAGPIIAGKIYLYPMRPTLRQLKRFRTNSVRVSSSISRLDISEVETTVLRIYKDAWEPTFYVWLDLMHSNNNVED